MSGNSKKVFCIGLSRTGTTALAHALNKLGILTVHYSLESFVQIDEIDPDIHFRIPQKLSWYRKWSLGKEIKAKQTKKVGRLLEQYDGFSDLPFPFLYRSLHKKFPQAKFIYTFRDEKKWLKSMHWLYNDAAVIWQHGLLDNTIMKWAYGTTKYDAARLLKVYRKHHREVEDYFHNNPNFLKINLDLGELNYDKLSAFLNTDKVSGPVERINQPQTPTSMARRVYWAKKEFAALDFIAKIIAYVRR